MTLPPRDTFAAAARQAVERHDEWDSPHSFETLHWDGVKLTTMTYAGIMPDLDLPDYPKVMTRLAREEIEREPGDPAYGYLLQTEGFRVREPGPDASHAERAQFEQDRARRTCYERADAVEVCSAWAADIHGRLWFAEKTRGQPGIREVFCRPGSPRMPGGPLGGALRAVAKTTGILCHGIPGQPPPELN